MQIAQSYAQLIGQWRGQNLLHLSWENPPDKYSSSTLLVAAAAKEACLSFTYTWAYEGVPQAGLIVLGYDDGQGVASAGFVDSWHQNSGIMHCKGSVHAQAMQGLIDVRGSYAVPGHPDWGWRIVIEPTSHNNVVDTLHIRMYNCSPEGVEELAVQADYTRVQPDV